MKLTEITTPGQPTLDPQVKAFLDTVCTKERVTVSDEDDGDYETDSEEQSYEWEFYDGDKLAVYADLVLPRDMTRVPVKINYLGGSIRCVQGSRLATFENFPDYVNSTVSISCAQIHSWEGLPRELGSLDMTAQDFKSFRGIHKYFTKCQHVAVGTPHNLLSLVQIPHLITLRCKDANAMQVIFASGILQKRCTIYDFQEMLIDAGLEQYAEV